MSSQKGHFFSHHLRLHPFPFIGAMIIWTNSMQKNKLVKIQNIKARVKFHAIILLIDKKKNEK